jgi:hypothetical protein
MYQKYNTKYKRILTKKFLTQEYIIKEKSIYTIGLEHHINHETIRRYLKNFNLLRTQSEARKIGINHHKKDCNCLSCRCKKGLTRGKNNPFFKGYKTKNKEGYIFLYLPNHPSRINNYIAEHRIVMEKYLNRYLKPTEIIHHKNGIKDDNRIENLCLCKSRKEHHKYHYGFRKGVKQHE